MPEFTLTGRRYTTITGPHRLMLLPLRTLTIVGEKREKCDKKSS